MTPLLEARNLQVRYGIEPGRARTPATVYAVNGVDLEVAAGEALGLVGESGSGKSTVGRALLRLLEVAAGSVRFDGEDVLAADARALRSLRRRMQVVFQDPWSSLDPRLPLGTSVAEGLEIHRIVPPAAVPGRVAALLREVGLDPSLATRFPHECSGGQRQRAAIARALAVDPRFLVLDEPVSALDVTIQAQVLALLTGLQRHRGMAMLFIGHDLAVVRQVARRIAVLYAGRIMECGPTEVVIRRPLHPYTRALVSAVPRPDPSVRRPAAPLAGEPPRLDAPPSGCPFVARCTHPARDTRCEQELPRPRPLADVLVACHHAVQPIP